MTTTKVKKTIDQLCHDKTLSDQEWRELLALGCTEKNEGAAGEASARGTAITAPPGKAAAEDKAVAEDKAAAEDKVTAEDKAAAAVDTEAAREYLFEKARQVSLAEFGNAVYIRGLIEVSNRCKNDCYYCGIRKSNPHVSRYCLTEEQILSCAASGYRLGFRTFVLQGGEDSRLEDSRLEKLIRSIKRSYPDTALTLSLGERSRESYQRLYDAGADRYLLRHETADAGHYRKLHPEAMSWENRMRCLCRLKEIGYQTGCGMMVGSPGQSLDYIIKDLRFMEELKPQMIGIGPFLPQKDTPFGEETAGSLNMTLVLLSILRLMFPKVLLPATTALNSLCEDGRERGILAGANVVMPNLSPPEFRDQYKLYDNKRTTGVESAEHIRLLAERLERIGYRIEVSRGDAPSFGKR